MQQRLDVLREDLRQRWDEYVERGSGPLMTSMTVFGVENYDLPERQLQELERQQEEHTANRVEVQKKANVLFPFNRIPADVADLTPWQYQQAAKLAHDHGVPLVDPPASSDRGGELPAAADPEVDAGALRAAVPGIELSREVETLFRGDSRTPAEIAEAGGFLPRERPQGNVGGAYDLERHQESSSWSKFVSTTTDYDVAESFLIGNHQFVYTIEAAGGFDINDHRPGSQYSSESETVMTGGVKLENITGAFMIEVENGRRTGEVSWVPRERFAEFGR